MFTSTAIIGVDKILMSTKCWRRQNTHVNKMLASTKYSRWQNSRVEKILGLTKCWRRLNTCVDKMLASTKYSRRQNVGVGKILASTKCWRRQNTRINKILVLKKFLRWQCWCRRRSIYLLFGSAESTAADFLRPCLFCTAMCKVFIDPPPDTQRTETQGERGIWVAMGCYLLHVTPLPLPTPSPLPKLCVCCTACGHVIWNRGLRESPTPQEDYEQILATSSKVEDGLHLGVCEYGSWIWTVIMYEFSVQWKDT